MKIQELLTDKSKWTKGEMARTIDGKSIPFDSNNAVCWCLLGAIEKCYHGEEETGISDVFTIINKIYDKLHYPLPQWNDEPKRTFEEVQQLIKELDI